MNDSPSIDHALIKPADLKYIMVFRWCQGHMSAIDHETLQHFNEIHSSKSWVFSSLRSLPTHSELQKCLKFKRNIQILSSPCAHTMSNSGSTEDPLGLAIE